MQSLANFDLFYESLTKLYISVRRIFHIFGKYILYFVLFLHVTEHTIFQIRHLCVNDIY